MKMLWNERNNSPINSIAELFVKIRISKKYNGIVIISYLLRACLLDAFETTLRTLNVLIARKAKRKACWSMAGLRRWEGQLLESKYVGLFVCLHPDNKVALNYETAYDRSTYLYYTRHDQPYIHILIFSIHQLPISARYIKLKVYKTYVSLTCLSIYLFIYLSETLSRIRK